MTSSEPGIQGQRYGKGRFLDPEAIVLDFCRLLRREIGFRKSRGLDASALKSYYGNLMDAQERLLPLGILGYVRRLGPMIEELTAAGSCLDILDAGSGYGTESLFFSLFGHRVTGVELVPERAGLAASRIPFFASACGFPLNVGFHNANILRFLDKADPFSMIWAMEAVSHIFPPEDFFRLAYSRLRRGGKLVISDPNNLNPVAWLRSVRIRGSVRHSTHTRFKDPETGKPVDYGQELTFTVIGLQKRLQAAGFRIEKTAVSGYMGSSVFPQGWRRRSGFFEFMRGWQNAVSRIPLIRLLGSNFTLVAVKDS